MNAKFKDPSKHILITPVDWFNFYGSFEDIFSQLKSFNLKSPTEACLLNPAMPSAADLNNPTFILTTAGVEVAKENAYDLAVGAIVSKFMILAAVKFKSNTQSAESYVKFELMKSEIPYIRVGTDYFKISRKRDRYGAVNTLLKGWKKETITDDHSKHLLQMINKYDDFTILPNNKEFVPVEDGCYNLYAKFSHQPATNPPTITPSDIPATYGMLTHIFSDQLETGLKYMKVLYEHPRQILPVLALVSDERDTGKTTFLNWISMIFGYNSVVISPEDLSSHFNSGYATHNIVMIDETVIEKSASVEKLKSLATAKTISVSQKFVQAYSVPFFGKIIFCTNKVKDFMRIDKQEIRFWVRRLSAINGPKNVTIEDDLFREIPMFLKYLIDLPEIDFSRSRMVFTAEEIDTDDLQAVKRESKSALHKELEILIDDYFNNHPGDKEFSASALNIKERWFSHNNQISAHYISKVLRDEVGMKPSLPIYKKPFNEGITAVSGRFFTFLSHITT